MQQRWWLAVVAAAGVGLAVIGFPRFDTGGAQHEAEQEAVEEQAEPAPVLPLPGASAPAAAAPSVPAPPPLTPEEEAARVEEIQEKVRQVRGGAQLRARGGRAAPDPSPEDFSEE